MSYRIQSGDTLSSLAARNGVSLAALERANPQIKNPNLIYAGERLNIPGKRDSFQAPGSPKPASGGGRYTVRSGDSMSAIASRHGVPLSALERANPQVKNPNLIYPGERLNIPGGGGDTFTAPPSRTPAPTPGPISGIPGGPGQRGNAQETINFFMSKGLTRAQAAGIAGNLQYESGFNPNAVGDGGTSFGIAQWHFGRGDAMKSYCTSHGYSTTSFKGQLEYLWSELNGSERGALAQLRRTSNPYDAGLAFERAYERPAVINPARGTAAQNFYNGSN